MFQETGDRVALHLLRRDNHGISAVDADLEGHPGFAEQQEGFLTGQGDVDGVGSGPVDDGGNSLCAAQPAGRALAEFGAGFSFQLVGGHVYLLRCGSGCTPAGVASR